MNRTHTNEHSVAITSPLQGPFLPGKQLEVFRILWKLQRCRSSCRLPALLLPMTDRYCPLFSFFLHHIFSCLLSTASQLFGCLRKPLSHGCCHIFPFVCSSAWSQRLDKNIMVVFHFFSALSHAMIIEQAAAIRCGVEDKNVNSVSWQDISFSGALKLVTELTND